MYCKDKLANSLKVETFLITAYLLGVYFFPDKIKIATICFMLSYIVVEIIKQRDVIVCLPSLIWLCYIMFSFLSCVWGKGKLEDVLEFVVSILMALFLLVFAFSVEERKGQLKGLTVVCLIVILGCVLQFVLPDFLKRFNANHLTREKYHFFDEFYKARRLVGFSFQTAITGFYLTILFGVLFSKFLFSVKQNNAAKNIVYLLSLTVIYIFVFLTAKRSFILLIPCGVFVLLCFHLKKHIGKIIAYFAVVIIVMMLLLYKTDFGQALLLRSSGDDWSTGRVGINEQMIARFWDAPIIGNGVCSTLVLLSDYQNAHNIYLQVLSESGVLGFCIVTLAFIVGLIQNIRVLAFSIENKQGEVIPLASISLFIQIIFLGWGFTGNPLYDVYPLYIYMISIGFINSIKKEQRVENTRKYESRNYYVLSQKQ